MVPEEKKIDELIGTLRQIQQEEIDEAEDNLKNEVKQAEIDYETELQEIDDKLTEQVDNLIDSHNEELQENVNHFQQLLSGLGGAAYHWEDEFWHDFSISTNDKPAECHRVGVLKVNGHFNQLETLALVPVINGQSVIFLSTVESRIQISQAFLSLILRVLVTSQKDKIRLVAIDPSSDENGITGLFPILKKSAVRNENKLGQVLEHLLLVKKDYLKDGRSSLVDVMTEVGYYPVPHCLIAISGFPHSFSEETIRQLITIMQEGPACGIHTVMVVDSEEVPDLDLDGLDSKASVIAYQDGRFVFGGTNIGKPTNARENVDSSRFDLDLDKLPEANLLRKLIDKIDVSTFELEK